MIKVVKKDGVREPFARDKVRQGLEKALWKRPISVNALEETVAAIESDVHNRFEEEVDSRQIGEIAMRFLGQLDQVAFVRFASVYREFKDVRDFVDELAPMLIEREKKD